VGKCTELYGMNPQNNPQFPPWNEIHELAKKIIRILAKKHQPSFIDHDQFVDETLGLAFIYYMKPKRRLKFRGDIEKFLKGNICLSAAQDVRDKYIGKKKKIKKKDGQIEEIPRPQKVDLEHIPTTMLIQMAQCNLVPETVRWVVIRFNLDYIKGQGDDTLLYEWHSSMWRLDHIDRCGECRDISRTLSNELSKAEGDLKQEIYQSVRQELINRFHGRLYGIGQNMAQTTLEKALEAIQEAEKIKKAAIDDLLKQKDEIAKQAKLKQDEIDKHLKLLGYIDTKKTPTAAKQKHCSICDIDGHDARAHRFQGKDKKKFTPDELAKINKP
jgi:hypothetical protein